MKKDSKRPKKKIPAKPKPGTDEQCEQKQQQEKTPTTATTTTTDTNSTESGSSSTTARSYTPLQMEQTQLAKDLDAYITEFQQKVFRLNFKPSERELVILFIMNLHPRFRRYVEPAELSCSNWYEAAAFARLHCTRISVMMGCERHDKDPIFRSPESKALLDSGYFASSSSPSSSFYPGEQSIQHLLSPTTATTEAKDSSQKSLPVPDEKTERSTTTTAAAAESSSIAESSSTKQRSTTHTTTTTESKTVAATAGSSNSNSIVTESKEKNKSKETEKAVNGDVPLGALSLMENNAHELMEMLYNEDEPEKAVSQAKAAAATAVAAVVARNNTKKDKEKDKQYLLPRVSAVKSNGSLTSSQSVCYRVPKEHAGVNLTFLELEINKKKVKGLLAKVRWGSSAIALDCARRLGLPIKETNNFCIYTDFGYEDSIGILKLPIVHPADSNIKAEMEIQVLPQIYGGHVDLVLGADFFYYFNPVLNIKTRAIHFLGKEAPYLVSTIV